MDCEDRLPVDALHDHSHFSGTPNVVRVSDIQLLANIDLVDFLLELPRCELTFLGFPLSHDIRVGRFGDQLCDHFVNQEAREERRALGRADRLVTHEAVLLDDQVFIDAFCAITVTTNGDLALVNKSEAEWTNE